MESCVDITIELLQPVKGPPHLGKITCSVLPWITENDRNFLDHWNRHRDQLRKIFPAKAISAKSWKKAAQIRSLLSDCLKQCLEEFEILAQPRISLVVTEFESNSLKGASFGEEEAIAIRHFENFALTNNELLKDDDINFPEGIQVFFSLNSERRTPSLPLEVEKAIKISKVQICMEDGECFASCDADQIISPEDSSLLYPQVPLPELSLEHFRTVEPETKLALSVTVPTSQSSQQISVGNLSFEIDEYESGVVDLFLDMGSTFTKYLEVVHSCTFKDWDETLAKKAYDDVVGLLEFDPSSLRVSMPEEISTQKFREERGVREFDKSKLLAGGASEISSWLIAACRDLVCYYADRGLILCNLTWSFPIEVDSAARISSVVSESLSGLILGSFYLVPEHRSLRSRFQKVVSSLSEFAREREDEREQMKETKESASQKRSDYDQSIWRKLNPFESAPSDPSKFSVPHRIKELEEFLSHWGDEDFPLVLFDAGGCTFDVYAEVGGNRFEKSFEAGGNDLTKGMRQLIAELRDSKVTQVPLSEAEDRKRMESKQSGSGKLHSGFRNLTENIYAPPIDEVFGWIYEQVEPSKTSPLVICTGGAMNNGYLREMLRNRMKGSEALVTSTQHLCELFALPKLRNSIYQEPHCQRFWLISHLLDPDRFDSRSSFDIVGGLTESAIEQI